MLRYALFVGLVAIAGAFIAGTTGGSTVHSGGEGCVDDAREDNDTPETSSEIQVSFNDTSLVVCEFDDDWFRFFLNAGQEIRVDATFFHTPEDDVDIYLYAPGGTEVGRSISASDNETILHTSTVTGTFMVRVTQFVPLGPNDPPFATDYNLSIIKEPVGPSPTPTEPGPTPTTPTGKIVIEKQVRRPGSSDVPGPDWNVEVFSGAGCTGIPVVAGETDDDGRVIFTVPAGEYSMSELMRPGWERVSAQACQAGAVGANQEIRRTFVNRRIPNGDVNGDGTTNSLDCVLVLQIVAALLDADDVEESARADVNEDDTIDTRDAALILQLDAGFIDELPLP